MVNDQITIALAVVDNGGGGSAFLGLDVVDDVVPNGVGVDDGDAVVVGDDGGYCGAPVGPMVVGDDGGNGGGPDGPVLAEGDCDNDGTPLGLDGRRDLRAEAVSVEHLLTHTPFNPHCPSCLRAKMSRKPARRLQHDPATALKKFGDLVNANHIIANSEDAMGLTGERDALAIVDRHTNYIDCYPLMTKTADDAYGALLDFFGRARPRYMWTDSSLELIRAIKDLRVLMGRPCLRVTRTTHFVNARFARFWRAHARSSNT